MTPLTVGSTEIDPHSSKVWEGKGEEQKVSLFVTLTVSS